MAHPPSDVEFKAVDGTLLRGRLYPASERGPALVLCPGFNCIKEMLGIPDVCQSLQQAGITALAYDPRTTGRSDGTPRNDIDPFKQVDDLSDALTFLIAQPTVDPAKVGTWGMSLGGAVALTAASIDRRARFVLAVCPAVEYRYDADKLNKVMAKCMRDRESQVKGNEPFYLPMMSAAGENQAGFDFGIDPATAAKMAAFSKNFQHYHQNRTTLQSYTKLVLWHPSPMWRTLAPTPALFVVPELDALCPATVQLKAFDELTGPKRSYVAPQKGHMDVVEGDGFADLMQIMISFINDALDGNVVSVNVRSASVGDGVGVGVGVNLSEEARSRSIAVLSNGGDPERLRSLSPSTSSSAKSDRRRSVSWRT